MFEQLTFVHFLDFREHILLSYDLDKCPQNSPKQPTPAHPAPRALPSLRPVGWKLVGDSGVHCRG